MAILPTLTKAQFRAAAIQEKWEKDTEQRELQMQLMRETMLW